jgi:endogenous inhibitor of DNA gyrase (YacG/DUF329 family)
VSDKIADLAALRAKRKAKRKCPICGKPATEASRPFCSETCRKVDLDRWRTETYRIPADESDKDAEALKRDAED